MLEPSEVIDLFFHHLPTITFQPGEIIFAEGDQGDRQVLSNSKNLTLLYLIYILFTTK